MGIVMEYVPANSTYIIRLGKYKVVSKAKQQYQILNYTLTVPEDAILGLVEDGEYVGFFIDLNLHQTEVYKINKCDIVNGRIVKISDKRINVAQLAYNYCVVARPNNQLSCYKNTQLELSSSPFTLEESLFSEAKLYEGYSRFSKADIINAKLHFKFLPGMIVEFDLNDWGNHIGVIQNYDGTKYGISTLEKSRIVQYYVSPSDIIGLVEPTTTLVYSSNGDISRGYVDDEYDFLDSYSGRVIIGKETIMNKGIGVAAIRQPEQKEPILAAPDLQISQNPYDLEEFYKVD